MAKRHLKRIPAPNTWQIRRKEKVWTLRPNPGSRPLALSMPLGVILRDNLCLAGTMREIRAIVGKKQALVNKKAITDVKFAVGFLDVLEIPSVKLHVRMILDRSGKLALHPIDEKESHIKLLQVVKSTKLSKGTQTNFSDGTNLLGVKEKVAKGDVLVYDTAKRAIESHLKLETGSTVFICAGKKVGLFGKLHKIEGKQALVELPNKEQVSALVKNLYVIGKDKPLIKVA